MQALSHKDGKALGLNILEFSDERHTCPVRWLLHPRLCTA